MDSFSNALDRFKNETSLKDYDAPPCGVRVIAFKWPARSPRKKSRRRHCKPRKFSIFQAKIDSYDWYHRKIWLFRAMKYHLLLKLPTGYSFCTYAWTDMWNCRTLTPKPSKIYIRRVKWRNLEISNLCRVFLLRGVGQMFGGSDLSRVERNFTIGQSTKIWGNFSKICIKINKNLQNYWENSRKMQIFRNFLIF